jgi:hypothetical protein
MASACSSTVPSSRPQNIIAVRSAIADSLFLQGHLAAARSAYLLRLATNDRDTTAILRLGLLALWANDLDEADGRLQSLLRGDSANRLVRSALAEIRRRQGRYLEAATLYRQLGRTGMAAKLAAISSPNEVSMIGDTVRLESAPNALLPVFQVLINGHAAYFLVDTGGGETIIDPSLADSSGVRRFGRDSASNYAGGKSASFEHGAVDSLRLGTAVIRNVPVQIQSTQAYSFAGAGHAVLGIIGTSLLSQFRSTLVFSEPQMLILSARARSSPRTIAGGLTFWLLSDHLVSVEGTAMGSVPVLLVYDTGLALPGGAFVPAPGFLGAVGGEVDGETKTGIGGGGAVSAKMFRFRRLKIGSITRDSVVSLSGVFPPGLEYQLGTHISGLVSHGFFTGRRVTLDFDTMQMIVE